MYKISILGSGTWGTALAHQLARSGHLVYLYSHFEAEQKELQRTHVHKNLPLAKLDERINYCFADKSFLSSSDMVVFAVPSAFTRATAIEYKEYLNKNQLFVNVAKGIEKDTLFTMSEIIKDVLGKDSHVCTLSGPSHAEEVAIDLPTCITAAGEDLEDCKKVQQVFSSNKFRVYTNNDHKGVEIAGALKNIIALACGISDGLGYGDNAKAAIMTRGLFEITKIGACLGCDPLTFAGLSGMGDIVVTSTSTHSRNNRAGHLLGEGHPIDKVLQEVGMVVEGINCLDSAKQLIDMYHVSAPIILAVYDIVKNGKDPRLAVEEIFARDLIAEKSL